MSSHDAGTTVKRLESDMLNILREKFQAYSESILHLLNVELVIQAEGNDITRFAIPDSMITVSFHPENEGYGLKLEDGTNYAFVTPSELSIEEGESESLETAIMKLAATDIRTILELLKDTQEALQAYVEKRHAELSEKLDLIQRY